MTGRQEVFQKHGSTSLRAVELLPLYGDQILQFGQRTKWILINKLSLEYIYRFPIMWNYERDINHKSYMKNIVEAQIIASIIQSEGLRETNMSFPRRVQLCKNTSMEILFFFCVPQSPTYEFVLLEMTVKWWTTKCRLKHLFFPCRTDALIIDRTRIGSHPVWFKEVLVIGCSAETLHSYTCGAER